jgi:hypothetical protein
LGGGVVSMDMVTWMQGRHGWMQGKELHRAYKKGC